LKKTCKKIICIYCEILLSFFPKFLKKTKNMLKRFLVFILVVGVGIWWFGSRSQTPQDEIESTPESSQTETQIEAGTETDTEGTKPDEAAEDDTEVTENTDSQSQEENPQESSGEEASIPESTPAQATSEEANSQPEQSTLTVAPEVATAEVNNAPMDLPQTQTPPPVIVIAPPASQTVTPPVRETAEEPIRTQDIKIYLYEWGLDLSDAEIKSGKITFQVLNSGRFTHDLSISGKGTLGKVLPRGKAEFSIVLEPGEYELFSSRRNDREMGVLETLIVR
jgi:hypothetical protein